MNSMLLCLYDEVVNEACLADIYGNGNECLTADFAYALYILKVNNLYIVNASLRFCAEAIFYNLNDFLRIPLTIVDCILAFLQTLREY